MIMRAWEHFPRYVSAAEKRAKVEKRTAKLKNKNPNLRPVVIEGNVIAKTWWGKAWNKNLESYADYSTRIGRGRMYVRNSAVLDLKIESGVIESLVMGMRSSPYRIKIKINKIKSKIWKEMKKSCDGKFYSLEELLHGKFPRELETVFTEHKNGIFPAPAEISFDCNCPDWADMCKHIAATLYGVGSRLDSNPELFFTLRGVQMADLVTEAIKERTSSLLKKAKQKRSTVIDDSNLSEMFGIDLQEKPSVEIGKTKTKTKTKKTKTKAKTKRKVALKRNVTAKKKGSVKKKG
jgi:uncharacterized Zn finger protein